MQPTAMVAVHGLAVQVLVRMLEFRIVRVKHNMAFSM